MNSSHSLRYFAYLIWWRILRFFLFLFHPNTSHSLSLWGLKQLDRFPLLIRALRFLFEPRCPASASPYAAWFAPKKVGGVLFHNPILIAAGLVKGTPSAADNRAHLLGLKSWQGLNYSIEIGSFTHAVCMGNPLPTLWRDEKNYSLQNRIGLKNPGIACVVKDLNQHYPKLKHPYGINIALHPHSTQDASSQLLYVVEQLEALAPRVQPSWITLNLSCPNTPHQLEEELTTERIDEHTLILKKLHLPLWLKIPPALSTHFYHSIAQAAAQYQLDALIVSNTLASPSPLAHQQAGLSGKKLFPHSLRALAIMAEWKKQHQASFAIVGCGGIMDSQSLQSMIDAGCDAVQFYSALIYQGPLAAACFKYQLLQA